ncbi:hypothetical protein [Hyphomonas pacifica]|uniref:hypothetical protein n=1 Tax=Hyphomonas pacifica TaxID=1280941 RepID=UPI001313EB26|nr:hypothetical protein [Hyphomonas pacifica]
MKFFAMYEASSNSVLNRFLDEVAHTLNVAYRETSLWLARLDDMEKVFLLSGFILILFMLIIVKAAKRPHNPGKGRSFFTSLVLVMVFAFGAGWILDSRLDLSHYL